MPYICSADGHTLESPKGRFCPWHGTPILMNCPECKREWTIVGATHGYHTLGADFCVHCAQPGPWVSRQGRIAWIQGLLHTQTLDQAIELELRDALDLLMKMEPGDTRTIAAWRKLKDVAPKLWDVVKPIVRTVVTDEIKRTLGL